MNEPSQTITAKALDRAWELLRHYLSTKELMKFRDEHYNPALKEQNR